VVRGIAFDWSSYQSTAEGSDLWPLTWCEDDNQYTAFGDGGGFGGSNTEGRTSLGFARISGSHANFVGTNLWGGKDPIAEETFRGKTTSIFCLGGDLYAWLSPGSEEAAMDWKRLIVSEDKGVTWQEDAFPQSQVDGCRGCPGIPYTIQYGRNYGANSDGWVYTYWIEIQQPGVWEVQTPGVLWLSRARAANRAFTNRANWEWLVSRGGSSPQWGDMDDRAPVLEDSRGLMRGSAIFVPGLRRYLMVTNHTARNQGNLTMWEAPQPWGPWTKFFDAAGWPENDPDVPDGVPPRFALGNFSPKWFSSSGRSGVFVWFHPDQWNSVEVELDVR
jgi:hypothetical protein